MLEVDLTPLQQLQDYFTLAPERANKAAALALNQGMTRTAIPQARNLIQEQIAFPKSYLTGSAGDGTARLGVVQAATPTNLVAIIAGRDRPTSLARFSTFGAGGKGAVVKVKPGSSKAIPRAFRIVLRNGNVGLAMRLKPNEQLIGRRLGAQRLGSTGLVLLYGPSVDQVFRHVADDITPALLDATAAEFIRQFVRLSGTGGLT